MNTRTNLNSLLARRLAKKVSETNPMGEIHDIEDVVKSQYFSPLQTRQQRKNTKNPPKKLNLPSTSRTTPSIEAKKESKNVDSNSSTVSVQAPRHETKKDEFKGEAKEWEPKNWKEMLENIRKMRSKTVAPVDTMGCHKCSDEEADEKVQRYQKLVALMLSSQTKDETTYAAMQRLRASGLTPQNIVSMQSSKLEELLCPVSFYKNKAKYLQQTARILIDKFCSDIPNNIKDLVSLPGVGPKMAHICMATAWNEITGIGVDVHVHRITNRLHWVPKLTKEPEQTRTALEAWLPRELWQEVNSLLVGFGQTTCTPVRPHCGDCLNRAICPSAEKSPIKKKTECLNNAKESPILPIKKMKFQKKKIQL